MSNTSDILKLVLLLSSCVTGALGIVYVWGWTCLHINPWLGYPVAVLLALGLIGLLDKLYNLGETPRAQQKQHENTEHDITIEDFVEMLENRHYS